MQIHDLGDVQEITESGALIDVECAFDGSRICSRYCAAFCLERRLLIDLEARPPVTMDGLAVQCAAMRYAVIGGIPDGGCAEA